MMDLDRLAARCLFAGIAGPTATPEELALVRRGLGGVILFARNVVDPAQVAALSKQLKEASPGPLLICVDQEGGRVQRMRGPHWTDWPSARHLGALAARGGAQGLDGPALAEKVGRSIAKELSACGVDLNFAPVMDVDTNPANPVIGDRSFGDDEAQVAKLSVSFAKGLEAEGVASCAKHFPGHGDTARDSHHELPYLSHDLEQIWECELVPFLAAARAGLASVMTAHVVYHAIDSKPATLSSKAIALLRESVGYQNACLTDDMEMRAVADHYGIVDGSVMALEAGCDGVLVCHSRKYQEMVIEAIARAARSGPLAEERLAEAAGRIEKLQRFARPAASIDPAKAAAAAGLAEHRTLAQSLGRSAHTGKTDPTERRHA